MKVAAIIPAYNEETRLGTVLEAVKTAKTLDEIVVVSDGSSDGTCAVAATVPGVRVIDLEVNRGKGGAMLAGAAETDADIILFLDADLINLKSEHVDALVCPVKDGECDMAIGVFKAGRTATDVAQKLVPYISGQRALVRQHFLDIPELDNVRSGVEIAITRFYKNQGLSVKEVVLEGVTHTMKEEKLGVARGFIARLKMYRDIARIMLDGQVRTGRSRSRRCDVKSNVP